MKRIALCASLLVAGTVSASAADLAATAGGVTAEAPNRNWTGFYLGLTAGGAGSKQPTKASTVFDPGGYFDTVDPILIGRAGAQRPSSSGFVGGLTAGYNRQSGPLVLGIETDINRLHARGSSSAGASYPCCAPLGFTTSAETAANWLFTARGRLGILVTPQFLLYQTAGLAVGDVKANFLFTDTFANARETGSISAVRAGWTVGAGGEYAFDSGWSLKGEYLHVDLGNATATSTNLAVGGNQFPVNPFSHSVGLRSDIGRLGLNYKY